MTPWICAGVLGVVWFMLRQRGKCGSIFYPHPYGPWIYERRGCVRFRFRVCQNQPECGHIERQTLEHTHAAVRA